MKVRSAILVAISACSFVLPMAADAGHTECHYTTRQTVAGTLHFEDRAKPLTVGNPAGGTITVPPTNGLVSGRGTWVYLESNNKPGLQRGGESIILGDIDPEICFDLGAPDSLLI